MIIQFHTPTGIVRIDTLTASDAELTALKLTRESLVKLIPRDLVDEIDILKAKVVLLEQK